MSRIPLTTVDQQCEPIREFMARRGELNVFRLLARAPAVFVGWTQMVDEMLDSPTFTLRMRELIILRVAHLQPHRMYSASTRTWLAPQVSPNARSTPSSTPVTTVTVMRSG